MARILLVYGTHDGQTAKIALALAETLIAHGNVVRVVNAAQEQPRPYDYDAVIVAAPVRAGAYPKAVQGWVDVHSAALNVRPTAFVSVCLGMLQKSPAVDANLRRIVDTFLAATAWHPTVTKSVAGALLYTQYNWVIRWVMKRIARNAGGDTDTSRDYEYTDWNELRGFASAFSRMVQEHLLTPAWTGKLSLSA
jgi:menaquinone-dependent protoporphyrinogen oxidase